MSKQSSVEWLIQQFKNKGYIGLQDELQAKQMHKEEIKNSYSALICDAYGNVKSAEQYYQETYGGSPKTSDN